jgi:ribosomal protein L28
MYRVTKKSLQLINRYMCEICGNNVVRTYKHIKSSEHTKKLFAVMRAKKTESIKKYGYYKYV